MDKETFYKLVAELQNSISYNINDVSTYSANYTAEDIKKIIKDDKTQFCLDKKCKAWRALRS